MRGWKQLKFWDKVRKEHIGGQDWVYLGSDEQGEARYLLGIMGDDPVIVIGLNPSTARPGDLDPTLKRVDRVAEDNGYKGWLMLNLYPVRQTSPCDLDSAADEKVYRENINTVQAVLDAFLKAPVWLAWGGNIADKGYLRQALSDVAPLLLNHRCVCYGPCLKGGHPHHPLYTKCGLPLTPFPLREYMDTLKP